MPTNKFPNHAPNPETSPTDAAAVTPSDADELPFVSRVIQVGTGGVVQVVPLDKATSDEAVAVTVPDGGQILLQAVKIKATGTTASGIVIFA